jgi:hypothetical protein
MHYKTLIMTNSTISKNQVKEHFTSVSGILINPERITKTTEAQKAVQNEELTNQNNNSDRERMFWIEEKLSQRSYVSGYKGL